jgi:hypothetical protein
MHGLCGVKRFRGGVESTTFGGRRRGGVPSKLRAHGLAAAVALPHTIISIGFPRIFITLVYSHFVLIKIKLKKGKLVFCNFGSLIDLLSKSLLPPPPPQVARAKPIAAQKTPWDAHFHFWLRGSFEKGGGESIFLKETHQVLKMSRGRLLNFI